MSVQPEQVPGAQTPAPHRLQTAKCIARRSASPVRLWRRTMHALAAAAAAHPALPLLPCRQIAADYADRRPLIIGTLKGAVVFLSDLVRAIEPLPPGLEVSKGRGWMD